MHKYLLSTAAVFAVLTTGAQAEVMFKPYIGFDLQQYRASYADGGEEFLEDHLDGANIHVGARLHRNFGAELGYFRTREESQNADIAGTAISTDVQVQGVTLDGLGYLPLDAAQRFELIGTAGISYSKAEISIDVPGILSGSDDDSEFGFRAGAGAQYGLTSRLNARALARYQSADFDDVAERAWIYTAGLNYSF